MPAMSWVALWGMILTEHGLHFRRDGDRGRCVEWPNLATLPGERTRVDQHEFATLPLALVDRHGAEFVQGNPEAARPTRG